MSKPKRIQFPDTLFVVMDQNETESWPMTYITIDELASEMTGDIKLRVGVYELAKIQLVSKEVVTVDE